MKEEDQTWSVEMKRIFLKTWKLRHIWGSNGKIQAKKTQNDLDPAEETISQSVCHHLKQ